MSEVLQSIKRKLFSKRLNMLGYIWTKEVSCLWEPLGKIHDARRLHVNTVQRFAIALLPFLQKLKRLSILCNICCRNSWWLRLCYAMRFLHFIHKQYFYSIIIFIIIIIIIISQTFSFFLIFLWQRALNSLPISSTRLLPWRYIQHGYMCDQACQFCYTCTANYKLTYK